MRVDKTNKTKTTTKQQYNTDYKPIKKENKPSKNFENIFEKTLDSLNN